MKGEMKDRHKTFISKVIYAKGCSKSYKLWKFYMISTDTEVISTYHLSDQGTFTPVGAQGGNSMETSWENHFPTRILQWNLHNICTGYKKSQFCKKKFEMLFRFKMAAK